MRAIHRIIGEVADTTLLLKISECGLDDRRSRRRAALGTDSAR
jgi:hypothetical protein